VGEFYREVNSSFSWVGFLITPWDAKKFDLLNNTLPWDGAWKPLEDRQNIGMRLENDLALRTVLGIDNITTKGVVRGGKGEGWTRS